MHSSRSILVISDEMNLRCTLSMIIQRAGHRVAVASNLIMAKDALEERSFDLLFLDCRGPESLDLPSLNEIREQYPPLEVIILTPPPINGLETDRTNGNRLHYLPKPAEPIQILTKIDELLRETNPSW